MTDEFEALKREYRSRTASPHLLTRIKAETREHRTRSGSWLPLLVSLPVIAVIVLVLPRLDEAPDEPATAPVSAAEQPERPSLSALAALKPGRPAGSPSLSNVRSVPVPALPPKPKAAIADPASTHNQNSIIEEKTHVIT